MLAKSLIYISNMLLGESIKKDRENDYCFVLDIRYTDIPAKTAPKMLNHIPFFN